VVNGILKEKWLELSDSDKVVWRDWSEWDKKRFARDLEIFEKKKVGGSAGSSASSRKPLDATHVPKKRKSANGDITIPKKRKR